MNFILRNGRLTAIEYNDQGMSHRFPDDWSLFVLRFRDDRGHEIAVYERNTQVVEESNTHMERIITYSWTSAQYGRALVRVFLQATVQEVLLRAEVTNDTGLQLVSFDFPRLPATGITAKHALYLATPWGSRNFDPINFLRDKHNGEVFRRYPADLAMQYTMIGDGRDLHYLSAYHTGDETFEVWCSVISNDTICLTNRWYPFLNKRRWSTPPNGIAHLRGDWHVGADLYRSHMSSVFRPPRRNPWLQENFHGWMQVGLKSEGKPPAYRFTDIPALYSRAASVGISVIHVYGWAGRAFDTMYPDYDINPELGDAEELRDALDQVKAMGGRVQLYTNGRLVDPDSRFFKTIGSDCIIIGEDGNPPTEQYGTSVVFYIACPSCAEYQSYFQEQLRRIVEDFRAHAVQIDQVSCNHSYLCYSTKHGHSKPSNNWLPGIEKFLTELRAMYTEINPEFWVWVEGMNERFGQYYDINQGQYSAPPWNIGDSFPEQFKYTYPEYLITHISNTIPQACHALAQCKPFDFMVGTLDDEQMSNLLRDLVHVRKREPSYFKYGEFRDTVGFAIDTDAIEARLIRGTDGGNLVTLWNHSDPDQVRNTVEIYGEAITGTPRVVYPSNVEISSKGNKSLIRWSGPIACVAWE